MPVCTTTTEWIRANVSKPIEEWEERSEEKCKKQSEWNPWNLRCFLVAYLVRVIRWVVISVVGAVISMVCRLITLTLGIISDSLKFLGLLLKAVFTWDKCVFQEALAMLGHVLIRVLTCLGVVIFQPPVISCASASCENHVKDDIEKCLAERADLVASLKCNFHLDSGVFGYRLN